LKVISQFQESYDREADGSGPVSVHNTTVCDTDVTDSSGSVSFVRILELIENTPTTGVIRSLFATGAWLETTHVFEAEHSSQLAHS
jgi:hypothetical protein